MKSINMEVIEKLLAAKRLEKEAFMMLFPEKIQEHMEVISHEIKEMVFECILDWNEKDVEASPSASKKATTKVEKIHIN